jgi:hypothetical protein
MVASALALGACRKSVPPANLLPETVGAWKRTALGDGAATANSVIPPGSIRRTLQARYSGGGAVDVTLYELASSAAALDAVQRWRPKADTVFFYRDEFFVVVQYRDADRKALNAFVGALDKHLTPPK